MGLLCDLGDGLVDRPEVVQRNDQLLLGLQLVDELPDQFDPCCWLWGRLGVEVVPAVDPHAGSISIQSRQFLTVLASAMTS